MEIATWADIGLQIASTGACHKANRHFSYGDLTTPRCSRCHGSLTLVHVYAVSMKGRERDIYFDFLDTHTIHASFLNRGVQVI